MAAPRRRAGLGWSRIYMLALKKCRIGEAQDSRWLRETKEECAGKDVFLLEIAKGRALDGSAPFDSEGGYVVVKLEFIFFSVNKSYLSVEYLLHILDGHNYP